MARVPGVMGEEWHKRADLGCVIIESFVKIPSPKKVVVSVRRYLLLLSDKGSSHSRFFMIFS